MLTGHSRPSRAMSADGIGRLRRVTARDARDFAARVLNEADWMIAQESDERGNRVFPLARAHLLAHGVHYLVAVRLLRVSDALTQRPLCLRIASHRVSLCPDDIER